MPYVLISTQIRMEVGPTMVGDEHSDPNLMHYLGATKRNMLGNHFVCMLQFEDDRESDIHNPLGRAKRELMQPNPEDGQQTVCWEYYVQDAPRIVLDKLEKRGYRVISMTGVGQTLVWCLHKENTENSDLLPAKDVTVNRPA